MNSPTNTDEFLVKAGGMALFIAALMRLPETLGTLAKVPFCFYQELNSHTELGSKYNQLVLHDALRHASAFLLLLLLARWVFGHPNVLRKFLQRFPSP